MILLNDAIDCLSISQSVPEIFAVKLKSCPTSHQISDIFSSGILRGQCPPKVDPYLAAHHAIKFREANPFIIVLASSSSSSSTTVGSMSVGV